ncbi:MAG TPA: 6-phosphofructokinase [Acidimicrobiia bacterium]|nr:6-phosphofructokinase [Acidimicrobiia bacterium]
MSAIAVLTSGGDAPGMNAAIRAITKVAASHGIPTWGVEDGFDGLIDGTFRPLIRRNKTGDPAPLHEVESEGGQGGTILGSSRSKRFYERSARAAAVKQLEEYSITGVVVIGGNGSMAGIQALQAETDVPVVGIPASIDNDIGLTREALGVDSALNTIVAACDNISDTARSHHRAFIVEVMGRQSGYLAMAAAVATAADAVLMPERPHTREDVIESVVKCIQTSFGAARDKTRVLIIKAEGVAVPTHEIVEEATRRCEVDGMDYEVRGTVLGHVVRGGDPSFRDRLLAGRFGRVAVEAALEGRGDVMTGWNIGVESGEPTTDDWIRLFAIEDVLAETESLLDGTSSVSIDRIARMEAIQGVLAL